MAIRNTLLGGTDYAEEGLKPSDINGTFDATLNYTGKGIAQNAFSTIKAAGAFTNEDSLAADRFTDADGVNNTVNTGSSTAVFDTDNYSLDLNEGTPESSTTVINNDGQADFTTTIVVSGKGYFNNIAAEAASGGSRTITIKDSGSNILATKTFSAVDVDLVPSDYTRFIDNETITVEFTMTGNFIYFKNSQSYSGTDFSFTSQTINGESGGQPITPFTFTPATKDLSNVVICDSNTLTLDGTENNCCVYANKTLPTNTSVTVDISDGTTTISAQNLNEVIDISSLSSGTLEIIFKLGATDDSTPTTPELFGYGVYLS